MAPAPHVVWFQVDHVKPPQKMLLMTSGPSGYNAPRDQFLALAYVDEDFRPSLGGALRWQTVTDDDLSDNGWVPTHWAYPVNLAPPVMP